jgi:N-acetylglutamate synthase-like GNAT family acetyltransferase
MPVPSDISIRVAEYKDYQEILEFIREHYYKEEPITVAHPISGHTKDDEDFTMSHVTDGTVLIALDNKNGKIVGALVAGPIEIGDAEKMLKDSEKSEKKWSDIQKFLAYIETKADVLRKFNLDKALHCHALGVHCDYRGLKIGQRLFEKCFKNASNLNYKLLSVDCTSVYSIKISEKLGMDYVSTVTYDEYHKVIGCDLFQYQQPNTQIKTFVKFI